MDRVKTKRNGEKKGEKGKWDEVEGWINHGDRRKRREWKGRKRERENVDTKKWRQR